RNPAAGKDVPAPPLPPAWVETGVRSGDKITVSKQEPGSNKDFKWEKPKEGYLSQVEVLLLDALLPHTAATDVGFYAYYPLQGKLTFRSERVAPQPDGSCRVYSRPAPEHAEQVSYFGTDGRLQKRVLPGG